MSVEVVGDIGILAAQPREPRWRVTAYLQSGGIRFTIKDVPEDEVPMWTSKGTKYSDVVTIKVEREK